MVAPGGLQQAHTYVLSHRSRLTHDVPCDPTVEIAIYPDVIWLTARILLIRSHSSAR